MEPAFNVGSLFNRIESLPFRSRLAFLLSCAERLVPNYSAFSTHHGWGDIVPLQQALNLGWKHVSGEQLDQEQLENCLARCVEVTPDTENFDSEFVSAGLDAAVCCGLVLELIIGKESSKVVEGASLARDTVDLYVQQLEALLPLDLKLEEKILQHPLMQRELRRQREDLDMLEKIEPSDSSLSALIFVWGKPVLSNIDRRGVTI